MAICEGAVRYWGPHSQPPGMMANTKITCRFPWAFAAAFCLNTSAWSLYTYPFCLQLSLFLRSGWRNIYKTSFDGALWVSDVWQDVSVSRALKRGWTSLEKIRIEHLLSRFLVFFFFFLAHGSISSFSFLSSTSEMWFIAEYATSWKPCVPSNFYDFKSWNFSLG